MTNDDWTKEIREKLDRAHGFSYTNDPSAAATIDDFMGDIARLLEEREVLREALKFYANDISYVSRQGFLKEIRRDRFGPADNAFNPIGTIASKALAYDPRKEKV